MADLVDQTLKASADAWKLAALEQVDLPAHVARGVDLVDRLLEENARLQRRLTERDTGTQAELFEVLTDRVLHDGGFDERASLPLLALLGKLRLVTPWIGGFCSDCNTESDCCWLIGGGLQPLVEIRQAYGTHRVLSELPEARGALEVSTVLIEEPQGTRKPTLRDIKKGAANILAEHGYAQLRTPIDSLALFLRAQGEWPGFCENLQTSSHPEHHCQEILETYGKHREVRMLIEQLGWIGGPGAR